MVYIGTGKPLRIAPFSWYWVSLRSRLHSTHYQSNSDSVRLDWHTHTLTRFLLIYKATMLPRSKKRNPHTLSCFLGQFNLIWVCWQYRFTAFERFNINRPCRRCHVYICSYYRSVAEYERSKRVLLFSSFTRTFG